MGGGGAAKHKGRELMGKEKFSAFLLCRDPWEVMAGISDYMIEEKRGLVGWVNRHGFRYADVLLWINADKKRRGLYEATRNAIAADIMESCVVVLEQHAALLKSQDEEKKQIGLEYADFIKGLVGRAKWKASKFVVKKSLL